jgi:hypothetical protein
MSADDDKFFSGLKALHGQPAADQGGGWSRLAGATGATLEGVGKGIANVSGNLPTLIGLPALHSQWASSTNKDYPIAEGAGKFAPDLAALAFLPNVGMEGLATEAVPALEQAPRLAKAVGNVGEAAWKGYVGGGTQGHPGAGSATATGSRTLLEAAKAIPGKQFLLPAAMVAAAEMAGRGYTPWGVRHMLSYLAEAAAALSGKLPGSSGAIGASIYDKVAPPDNGGPQKAPWDKQ